MSTGKKYDGLEIAIIGISAQFPRSKNYSEFWQNLSQGIEMIETFTDEELRSSGVSEMELQDSLYVRSTGVLKNKDSFDSSFFGYTPEEAALMDPQLRLFHEHCWMALEDAGCSAIIDEKKIGLFAGASINDNWKVHVYDRINNTSLDPFYVNFISNQTFISTLVSYKLNLRGPSVYVDTACSTSLTAVHMACRSLLMKECNVALAGGIHINTIKRKGYFYRENMILSRDGHCRAFDSEASGIASGEGVGVVALKCLQDAINDRDNIYAIIRSTAVNNDGNGKVGFTAPSVKGQSDCITRAHKLAGVDPRSITYIETHGTGTKLGDPIEIMALNNAFGVGGSRKFCAIGSVKTNMGHLDVAAGIAGLIKTALSLKYQQLPASLNYKQPNPDIDFEGGPFYVNTELKEWLRNSGMPLRAGVSSFGIGGTNVHAVLEEAPREGQEKNAGERNYKLITLSAKTKDALDSFQENLKNFIQENPDVTMADMSYTLQTGRKHFQYRRAAVYKDREELLSILKNTGKQSPINIAEERGRPLVFMFPGQGSQYAWMGKDLYFNDPFFRSEMDKGFYILSELTGENFKEIIYPANDVQTRIQETRFTQPLIFLFEYALARMMMSYGLKPQYMIGHSIGEYTAACISGVWSFEDALRLVAKRGELMNALPDGEMVGVSINEELAGQYLSHGVSIAAINGPEQVVLSGDRESMRRLIDDVERQNIPFVKLHTSHAFHSGMQDPVMAPFWSELEKVKFNTIGHPFISNVSGELIKDEQACSAGYWVKHLRETVRFADGLKTLFSLQQKFIFIEVGAGHSLSNLLKQQYGGKEGVTAVNLVRSAKETVNDELYLNTKIGELWAQGAFINWAGYSRDEKRRKISLPTYSFQRIKYPAEVNPFGQLQEESLKSMNDGGKHINNWFYTPQWRQSLQLPVNAPDNKGWATLVFADDEGLAERLIERLNASASPFYIIRKGKHYRRENEQLYFADPRIEKDLEALFGDLQERKIIPHNIIHLWSFENGTHDRNDTISGTEHFQTLGYNSIVRLVRAFSSCFPEQTLQINFIANGLYSVLGNESICPVKSAAIGAMKVIPGEFEHIYCRSIDITDASVASVNALAHELQRLQCNGEMAIRGRNSYVRHFEKLEFQAPLPIVTGSLFRKNGTYLITGGHKGMGRLFAGFLADEFSANLVLMARSEVPADVICDLERRGGKVVYLQTDIADEAKVIEGIVKAESLLGKVNGVIHCAGLGDFGGVIVRRDEAYDKQIFAPKIYGTEVLYTFFKDKAIDFFVNCSSQAASLAPIGQVAYVAANNYQDAFAERGNPFFPIISIEWPALKEIGMTIDAISHLSAAEQANILHDAISPSEAIEVLEYALVLKLPLQIISMVNFQQLIKRSRSEFVMRQMEQSAISYVKAKRRDNLGVSYRKPQTEVEKTLAGMLEEFLCVEEIGLDDDFFELGGDSLKAMTFIKRINKEFDIHIPLRDFLDLKTAGRIAGEIENINWLKRDVSMSKKIII